MYSAFDETGRSHHKTSFSFNKSSALSKRNNNFNLDFKLQQPIFGGNKFHS